MRSELLTFHVSLSKRIDDSVLRRSSFYDMLPLWPLLSLSLLHNIVKDNQIRVQKEKFSFPIFPEHKRVSEAWRYSALCLKTVTKKFPKQIICSWTFVDSFGVVATGPPIQRLNFSHSGTRELAWSGPRTTLRGYFQIQIRHRKFWLFSHANGDVFGTICAEIFFWWASHQRFVRVRVAEVTSLEGPPKKFQCQSFEHVNFEFLKLVASSHSIIRGSGRGRWQSEGVYF